MDVYNRLGQSWRSDYIGFFPGRPGAPTRIGGYRLGSDDIRDLFKLLGFESWNPDMIDLCRELNTLGRPGDYQFDILSDGSLSDVFGLAYALGPQERPKTEAESLRSGKGAQFMARLQELKLIDDRWKMLPDAVFARAFPYKCDDGSEHLMAFTVLLGMVKIKFKAGVPQSVKSYLALKPKIF
jgi:hypothetical protein